MNAKDIQQAICKREVLFRNLVCENIEHFHGEHDVLAINKKNITTEYEVKVSRSDFFADKKKNKWKQFEISDHKPNRIYFVCPRLMIAPSEIPAFAGLMYYDAGRLHLIKNAPLIHKLKSDESLIRKMLRIHVERKYIGACRMTYENKLRRDYYDKLIKEDNDTKKIN